MIQKKLGIKAWLTFRLATFALLASFVERSAFSGDAFIPWGELRQNRLYGHQETVSALAFNLNGRRLASSSYDKTIRIWGLPEGTLLQTLTDKATIAAFGHDLNAVAITSHPIQQLELPSGNRRRLLGDLRRLSYSPDGEILGDAKGPGNLGEDGEIRLWRVSDGRLLRTLKGHDRYVTSFAFTPDSQMLVSSGGDGVFRLWSVSSGELLRKWEQLGGATKMAMRRDGEFLATGGSQGGPICIWRLPDGKLLHQWNWNSVLDLAFSREGTLLSVCSTSDNIPSVSLSLHRVSDGKLLQTLVDDTPAVSTIAFNPEGDRLAAGMEDGSIRFFAPQSNQGGEIMGQANAEVGLRAWREVRQRRLQPHGASVNTLAFDADGKHLLSGGDDKMIRLMRLPAGDLRQRLDFLWHITDESLPIKYVAFRRNWETIVAGAPEQGLRVWRLAERRSEPRIIDLSGAVAVSPDGDYVALGQPNGVIRILHFSDVKVWRTLEGHDGAIERVVYSPNGKLLASSGADGTVRLWSVAEAKLLHTWKEHPDRVGSLAFSADSKVLAGGGRENGTICIWRVFDGALLQKWEWNPVLALAFSADGEMLAVSSTSEDPVFPAFLHLVRVFDGTRIQTLRDELPAARCVVFSPITDLLAAGMSDGSVRFFTPSGD